MEIGSFIELDLKQSGEYYHSQDIARLNSGRAGIFYSLQLLGLKKIYMPFYQCPSVSAFLINKKIEVVKYYLNAFLQPEMEVNEPESALLIVNYFGLFDDVQLMEISKKYNNVIVDNSQAFFTKPIVSLLNVYSPRKFFGVPDGCYVIGRNAVKNEFLHQRDISSDTSSFLLKRIELGCSAVYKERMMNEKRIDQSDVKRMSVLTHSLLANIDYTQIKERRIANFNYAHSLYKSMNKINVDSFIGENVVPMVYPLVIEKAELVDVLKTNHIYTGRWWSHVLSEVEIPGIEVHLSKYMIPLPIDQRYGVKEIECIHSVILENIK
jgi:hypothetical protein